MRGARYIGEEPHRVRIGDRGIEVGEIVFEPDDVVDALLERSDFEEVDLSMPEAEEPAPFKVEE